MMRSRAARPHTQFRPYLKPYVVFPRTGSPIFPTEPWGQIKGIGNRLRHEYFRIDDGILWEIMTTDIHALKTVMEAMLARHAGAS